MTCPLPSHSLEVLGHKGPSSAFSIAAWVGEMETDAQSWASCVSLTPQKGLYLRFSHFSPGLPNFPSFSELGGRKDSQLVAEIRLQLSDTGIL